MSTPHQKNLATLVARIEACRNCKDLPLGPRPILRVSHSARLVVAGQAPGTRVHETGVPFADPSGDRLRHWMGIDAATFYDRIKVNIIPMGFCYPGRNPRGGDLPPRPECRALWHRELFETIAKPELILVIGQYAQAWHLGDRRLKTLTETVRNWKSYLPQYLPMPHPSPRNNMWLRRNPWFEDEVIPELRLRVAKILETQQVS